MVAKGNVNTTLTGYLKELHLPTFRERFEPLAQRAQQETLSYEQYLLELAQQECDVRRTNRIERLLRQIETGSVRPRSRPWPTAVVVGSPSAWVRRILPG